MDAVFRFVAKGGELRLERSKSRPAALEPQVSDTFSTQVGNIRFVRDSARRISGFVLDAGRVRHVKFWKDMTVSRPSTEALR